MEITNSKLKILKNEVWAYCIPGKWDGGILTRLWQETNLKKDSLMEDNTASNLGSIV